jgi:hypothetical protein
MCIKEERKNTFNTLCTILIKSGQNTQHRAYAAGLNIEISEKGILSSTPAGYGFLSTRVMYALRILFI